MINERVLLVEGAGKRWHISLHTAEGAPVDLSAYLFYGGAASRSRKQSQPMESVSSTASEVVLALPALPYGEWWHHQIYCREKATGREWLLVAGRIEVQERLGEPALGDTVAESESYLELELGSSGQVLGGTLTDAGPPGPMGESGQLQPYHSGALPATLEAGHAYDLGALAADTDLSALGAALPALPDRVQTAELWFSLGATAPAVTWPQDAAWPEEPSALAPAALAPARAYRFALRREPGGRLILCRAYEYSLA